MKSSLVRGVALLGAAVLLPFAAVPAAASENAPSTAGPSGPWSLHVIASAPQLPVGTRSLGALTSTATISGAVALQPSNDARLQQFIATVTEKGSPSFHRYLAPGTFRDRFGPSPTVIADVERAVAAGGLKVTGVARDGLMVSFSGTAARASATFHTGFTRYRLESGAIGRGTTGTASLRLPSSVAHEVVGVVGLDQLVQAMPAGLVRGSAAAHARFPSARAPHVADAPGAPSACTAAQQDAQTYGGLTDDSIANSYGADGLYRLGDVATGQHIAVYELESFSPSDIEGFDTCYFGATAAAQMSGTGGNIAGSQLSTVSVDGGLPPGSGSGESLLDIEDVSGMAPGANIDVYQAPNTTIGGLDEYSAIINNDADQVVTSSWGVCEQLAQTAEPGLQEAENVLFQQAAAQGQTVLSAEGDTGSDSCNEYRYSSPPSGQNVLSVLDPASQPYVVSVGGTTIDAATQPPSEHVWNDGADWGAGGGGISESWAMPAWQQAVTQGPANTAAVSAAETLESETAGAAAPFGTPTFCDGTLGLPANTPCRETPDVSAQADEFTGAVTVYEQGQWFTIGGTSSATPIWAAMLALVNASPSTGCSTELVNGVPDVGFASPILYGVAGNPAAYAASFNDITSGNNDLYGLDDGATFQASTGYDMASGLGSPQLTSPSGGIGLAYYMCSYGVAASRPVVSSLAPSIGRTGGEAVVGLVLGRQQHDAGRRVPGRTDHRATGLAEPDPGRGRTGAGRRDAHQRGVQRPERVVDVRVLRHLWPRGRPERDVGQPRRGA
jgi:subtilase family serine protease